MYWPELFDSARHISIPSSLSLGISYSFQSGSIRILYNLNITRYKSLKSSIFRILCIASLGVASRITVTIAASDDAHGVFDFSPEFLSVNGTEPEDGRSSVVLQVSLYVQIPV